MRAEGLDAVTIDALGTVLELVDPVPALQLALAKHRLARTDDDVAAAFRAEVAHYVPRAHLGRDERALRALQLESTAVFLDALDAPLSAGRFAPEFLAAVTFRPLPGVQQALERLRATGLALACVSNWDETLSEHLARAGLAGFFDTVVTSARAGAPKPDPRVFHLALADLGVEPGRALHIGDGDVDRDGAHAAGLAFEPTPVVTLPARLGLDG